MKSEGKLLLSRNLMNDTPQFYVGYYNSTQAKPDTKYCKTKNSASVWISECVSDKRHKKGISATIPDQNEEPRTNTNKSV